MGNFNIFIFCVLFLLLSFNFIYFISFLLLIFVLLLSLIFIRRIFLIIIFVLSMRRIILSSNKITFQIPFGLLILLVLYNNFSFLGFNFGNFHELYMFVLGSFIILFLVFYIVHLLSI